MRSSTGAERSSVEVDLRHDGLDDRVEQGVLAGEVVVHGHGVDVQLRAEPAHGERARPLPVDQAERRGDDALARERGVPAPACGSPSACVRSSGSPLLVVDRRILHRRIAAVTFYTVEVREEHDDRTGARAAPAPPRSSAGWRRPWRSTMRGPTPGRCASRSPRPAAAGSWDWASPAASGGADPAGQYFIASTTKLYVTALVMQLRAEGRLDLRAPAATYLDPALLDGIHVLRGVDSSARITVEELLAHTSGIADYFEQRRARRHHADRQGARSTTSPGRSTTCCASPGRSWSPGSRRPRRARRSTPTPTTSCWARSSRP